MQCKSIMAMIEQRYPKTVALGFDNVGLQAGRSDKEVKTIYLALDATDEVIEQAIAVHADLLITHHPLIFCPLKAVTDQDFVSRRILKLIQNDVAYYAMHTNYDVLGMAELAAEKFGLQDTEVLDVTCEWNEKPEGIGRVGVLPQEMTLEECCQLVKERLDIPQVQVFGELSTRVKAFAISPGSGKSAIRPAICKGAQVLVTGDIGHHEGLDAVEQGLCVIDAGHYGTEAMFIEDMKQFFETNCKELNIETAKHQIPFQII